MVSVRRHRGESEPLESSLRTCQLDGSLGRVGEFGGQDGEAWYGGQDGEAWYGGKDGEAARRGPAGLAGTFGWGAGGTDRLLLSSDNTSAS